MENKYFKYKNKYLNLKKLKGGTLPLKKEELTQDSEELTKIKMWVMSYCKGILWRNSLDGFVSNTRHYNKKCDTIEKLIVDRFTKYLKENKYIETYEKNPLAVVNDGNWWASSDIRGLTETIPTINDINLADIRDNKIIYAAQKFSKSVSDQNESCTVIFYDVFNCIRDKVSNKFNNLLILIINNCHLRAQICLNKPMDDTQVNIICNHLFNHGYSTSRINNSTPSYGSSMGTEFAKMGAEVAVTAALNPEAVGVVINGCIGLAGCLLSN